MCEIIKFPDGKLVRTVGELQNRIGKENLLGEMFFGERRPIDPPDDCLCNIDLEASLNRAGWVYENVTDEDGIPVNDGTDDAYGATATMKPKGK